MRIATALWPSTLRSWESFLLCKRFGQVLLSWLHSSSTWVCDPLGCSLVELYVAFLYDTGWLVPINVAGWKRSPLPDGTEMAPAVWVHEAHFPSLMLARQSLQQQVRTFATALRQLVHMCGVQLQFAQLPSLRALNVHYAAQSISVRSGRSLDSHFCVQQDESWEGAPGESSLSSPLLPCVLLIFPLHMLCQTLSRCG